MVRGSECDSAPKALALSHSFTLSREPPALFSLIPRGGAGAKTHSQAQHSPSTDQQSGPEQRTVQTEPGIAETQTQNNADHGSRQGAQKTTGNHPAQRQAEKIVGSSKIHCEVQDGYQLSAIRQASCLLSACFRLNGR